MGSRRAYAVPVPGKRYIPMCDIADVLDEHNTSIAAIADLNELIIYKQPGKRHRLFQEDDVNTLCSLVKSRQFVRDNYFSLSELARDRGRDIKYIKGLCKDAKVIVKSMGKGKSARYGYVANADIPRLDEVEAERLDIDMHFQSLFYVAEQIGMDHKTLKRACRKKGITIHGFEVKSGDYLSNNDAEVLGSARPDLSEADTGLRVFAKTSHNFEMKGYQTINSLATEWGGVAKVLKSYLGPLGLKHKQKGKVIYIADDDVPLLFDFHDKEEVIKRTCRSYESLATELGIGRKKVVNHVEKLGLETEELVNGRKLLTSESVDVLRFFFNDMMMLNSLADELVTHYHSLEAVCGKAGVPVFAIKGAMGAYILKSYADVIRRAWEPCRGAKSSFLNESARRIISLDAQVEHSFAQLDKLSTIYRKECGEVITVSRVVLKDVSVKSKAEPVKLDLESMAIVYDPAKPVRKKAKPKTVSKNKPKKEVLRAKHLEFDKKGRLKKKIPRKQVDTRVKVDPDTIFEPELRNVVTQSYVNDVRQVRIPTLEEQKLLAKFVEALGPDSREGQMLVEGNAAFAISVAKSFFDKYKRVVGPDEHPTYTLMDLVQEANLGMMHALNKFDVGRGVTFLTYAKWWMNQRLFRYGSENYNLIRLPKRVCEDVTKLDRSVKKLRSGGEVVTEKSIADFMGIPIKKVQKLLKASREKRLKSLDTKIRKDEDKKSFGDTVEDSSMDVYGVIELREKRLSLLEAISKLEDPRQELVIKKRWGLDDNIPRTLQQVGDEIGITKEMVRQIEAKALTKLRHPSRSRGIRDFYDSE